MNNWIQTIKNVMQVMKEKDNEVLKRAYPVGSIYMSANNVNPSTLFGGTWESWGAGRVPVGVDTSQSEFNTVGKTGGSKTHTLTIEQMPSHNHSFTGSSHSHGKGTYAVGNGGGHSHTITHGGFGINSGNNALFFNTGNGTNGVRLATNTGNTSDGILVKTSSDTMGTHSHGFSGTSASATAGGSVGNKGGGQAHNILQPYITCYMWKRTA